MSKLSIKFTSRIFIIAASFTLAGNAMAQENHIKKHFSTNGAKPVLIVSGDKCPSGFKVWDEARGLFLKGGEQDADAGIITGGAASVTLTSTQMPSHAHKTKIGQHIPSQQDYKTLTTLPNILVDSTSYERANTYSTGGSQPHNNVPPYIAVNFCVPRD